MPETHRHQPRRKDGKCKALVGGRRTGYRHCGEPADHPVHAMPLKTYRVTAETLLESDSEHDGCLVCYITASSREEAIQAAMANTTWAAEEETDD
jgi:hypothetical protein